LNVFASVLIKLTAEGAKGFRADKVGDAPADPVSDDGVSAGERFTVARGDGGVGRSLGGWRHGRTGWATRMREEPWGVQANPRRVRLDPAQLTRLLLKHGHH